MFHLLLLSSLASAAPADAPLSLDLAAVAELPISTGLQATLELPGRLRLGASLGRLPAPLVQGAGAVSSGWGLLDGAGASSLEEGLGQAWVQGASVGWRPFEPAGLWLAADWRRLRLGSSVEAAAFTVAVASDGEPVPLSGDPFELRLQADLLGASVGWDWVLAQRLTVRFSAGGLALRGVRSEVEPGDSARAVGPEQAAADATERELEDLLDQRVVVPTLGLGLGWHFG